MFEVRRTLALRLAARFVMVLALVLAGGACTPGKPAATPSAAELEALRPADARLAAIYERACMLCHARVGTGAPLLGDGAAWAPRLAKGAAALRASVVNGLGGMPARGLCPDCSDVDLDALTRFLAEPGGGAR